MMLQKEVDKYVLREQLGRDAVTEVWRAFDPNLQRDIVIKLLRRSPRVRLDFVQRFLQEARAMAALHHPNIVQVYDIAEVPPEDSGDMAAYMVTSFVQGVTLADYIAQTSRAGKFPSATQIVQLFTAIGSAIDYAHRQGVIHGDINPTSILLDQRINPQPPGLPLLTDFGFARLQSAGADSAHEISIVIGSPLYVAPELARGSSPAQQSDLYALGMILYELCTGKHPFTSLEQRPLTLLFQKLMSAPTPPSHFNPAISPALDAVILRSIANDPRKRFPTAQAMVRELALALSVPLSQLLAVEYYALYPAPAMKKVPGKTAERGGKEEKDEKLTEPEPSPHPAAMLAHRGCEPERRLAEKGTGQSVADAPAEWLRRHISMFFHRLRASWFVPLPIASFLVIAALLFLTSGAAGRLLSHSQATSSAMTGQVLFLSSGQGDVINGQGINDEVRVDLTDLAEPAAGKAYFAWLQGDLNRSDSSVVLLGQLKISQGATHLTYVDPQHIDLLATMSRFLVTEENANARPIVPSPDRATWKYTGAISQTPNPTDQHHYSLLDHLRHLLAADPELEALGLHDGLSFWFYRNSGLVQQYAQSAQKSFAANNSVQLYQQLVSLLDYLDGIKDVGRDVPAGTPIFADTTSAQVGLLQLHADQNPPSYLYHIGLHLSGLLASPGATIGQRKVAISVVQALDTVSLLLEQVRAIARQLVAPGPDQLLQPQFKAQLTRLTQLATAAYSGQEPGKEGVSRVHAQLAGLALIPITAYQAP
jgi:serine/threonine protein kinase